MQIFEFHFNPKTKEEIIFDSFIYEPENVYEKKLGNLYVAGELTNALPQNYRFLNNLASAIKESYYQLSAETSLERSLKNSLKKANNFLENQEKEGNISWLGNLNLAVVSIKDFKLNFTKVGDIKVLLARGKQITDIGQELEAKESEASPLKIFSNIISGKLALEDKIIILTKKIGNLFEKEGVFPEVLSVFEKDLKPEKTDQELKRVLNQKRSILADTSGLFLLVALETIQKEALQIKKLVAPKKRLPLKFPSLIPFTKIKEGKGIILSFLEDKISFLNRLTRIKDILILPKKKLPEIIKKPKIPLLKKLPSIPKKLLSLPKELPSVRIPNLKEFLILIFLLIIILGSGNYIFGIKKQKEIERIQAILTETQQIIADAENSLIFNDEKRANLLYQEAWNKILPLTKEARISLKNEVLNLKESIEKELFPLNKVEKISEPQIIFEFKSGEFSPQKMTFSNSNLYFLNPDSDKIYSLEINKEGSFIQAPSKIKLSTNLGDSILFFSEPNQLFSFEKNELTSTKTLEDPYPDSSFEDFSTFGSNLYFLDSSKGEIVKFKFGEESHLSGELWLNSGTKKPLTAKSMAIDGSIWILNKDNNLSRYHINKLQEELILDFFPSPEGTSKILTQPNLPYLYLLTPNQNRIVVLNKNGEVIKQYQSDKFDDLKDLAFSENGSIIYLLNNLKVYQIEF